MENFEKAESLGTVVGDNKKAIYDNCEIRYKEHCDVVFADLRGNVKVLGTYAKKKHGDDDDWDDEEVDDWDDSSDDKSESKDEDEDDVFLMMTTMRTKRTGTLKMKTGRTECSRSAVFTRIILSSFPFHSAYTPFPAVSNATHSHK